MKRKDFSAPAVVTYGKMENSAAIRENLLYILDLFSDLFKLALHINDDTGDFRIVSL